MNYSRSLKYLLVSAVVVSFSGCISTLPKLGGGGGGAVSGSAAGSSSSGENSQLEKCDKTLGTLTIFEDQTKPWWNYYYQHYYKTLGSTVPVIRTMVQQSNCFVIVERGAAMQAMQRERQLMNSGELRSNSNFGKGQLAAADYTLSPSVNFKQSTLGKLSGAANRLTGGLFGSASVGAKSNEAETTLLMIDNRSGVQVSASIGSAKNFDFSFAGSQWARGAWGSASGYSSTPEGKVIIAAFADSFNQMVKALRNYKPQRVKGGLGTGGALEVDGAKKAAPRPESKAPAPAPKPAATVAVASSGNNFNVNSNQSTNVRVDAYDENALNDYYNALKKAVESLSKFSAMTAQQVNAINQQYGRGIDLWTLLWSPAFAGEFETSKIELESWPLSAKQQGWKILGKKIKKYNKLFYKHRKLILESEGLRPDIRKRLIAIELVTEKSLFEE